MYRAGLHYFSYPKIENSHFLPPPPRLLGRSDFKLCAHTNMPLHLGINGTLELGREREAEGIEEAKKEKYSSEG